MTSTAHLARPRAVEVGGGFAGIDAAWALEHSDTDVNLVVRRSFHTFGTDAKIVNLQAAVGSRVTV
jgi:NADH dehydrogenase FAD-containing subunit